MWTHIQVHAQSVGLFELFVFSTPWTFVEKALLQSLYPPFSQWFMLMEGNSAPPWMYYLKKQHVPHTCCPLTWLHPKKSQILAPSTIPPLHNQQPLPVLPFVWITWLIQIPMPWQLQTLPASAGYTKTQWPHGDTKKNKANIWAVWNMFWAGFGSGDICMIVLYTLVYVGVTCHVLYNFMMLALRHIKTWTWNDWGVWFFHIIFC